MYVIPLDNGSVSGRSTDARELIREQQKTVDKFGTFPRAVGRTLAGDDGGSSGKKRNILDVFKKSSSPQPTSSSSHQQQQQQQGKDRKNLFDDSKGARGQQQRRRVLERYEVEYLEGLKALKIAENAKKEIKYFFQMLEDIIKKKYGSFNVDEISENVQNGYQKFSEYLDTTPNFADLSPELKEQIIDFFEKSIMTKYYK